MFSHAEEVAHYLEKRRPTRRAATAVYLVLLAFYVVWRFTVLNDNAMAYSVLFLLADLQGALLGLCTILQSWSIRVREAPPTDHRPTVDVFLPVYTEPVDMIELTILGAKSIDYPHETFLLDDGKRDELKALAEKHGIRYLRREGNRGAKAGNLNHGLAFSTAEVVAVFDADHIPKREALDMLVGYLKDEKVAVAQTPQCYYNEDSFLYREDIVGGGRWHEQSHFMDVIQGHRDLADGSSCIGTGCVYRRAALDDIGGFPEATLTEDLHSSLLFHKQGWKTVWVNEPVAWGVAAADVGEYYKMRRRWTYGNLQGFALERVLTCPGLSWRQRVGYLAMGVDMLSGWMQLVYILVPIISLLGFITPFRPGLDTLLMFCGYPFLLVAAMVAAGGGYTRFFTGQVFSMGKLFMQLESTRGLLGKKMAWQISLKNVLGRVSWGKLALHVALLIGSALALLAGVLRYAGVWGDGRIPDAGGVGFALAIAWVLVNGWRSWKWISDSVRLTRRTHREYLFEAELPVLDENGQWLGHTRRVSTQQAEVVWQKRPQDGQKLQLLIPGHAVWMRVKSTAGEFLEMEAVDGDSHEKLRRSLYSVDWHRMVRLSKHLHTTQKAGLAGDWQPCVLDGASWALWLPSGCVMVAGEKLPGDRFELRMGSKVLQAVVESRIEPPRPVPRGLNDNLFNFYKMKIA